MHAIVGSVVPKSSFLESYQGATRNAMVPPVERIQVSKYILDTRSRPQLCGLKTRVSNMRRGHCDL